MAEASLYDHPELYDALLFPGAQSSFYRSLAHRHPGPILELACGTGQLTIPIARAGQRTVGLDLSPGMLAVARAKAETAGAMIEWIVADMRRFELGQRFAVIFIARNSLLHLSDPADFSALFEAVRRHLAPGGVFAFDIFNPDVRILASAAGERSRLMQMTSPLFGELIVETANDYDAAAQVNRATWFISAPQRGESWTIPLHLRSIFPQELSLLLATGGLRLLHRMGDFEGAPFESRSAHQVCVCETVALASFIPAAGRR